MKKGRLDRLDPSESGPDRGKSASRTKARVMNQHSSFDVASIGYFRDSDAIDSTPNSFSVDAFLGLTF